MPAVGNKLRCQPIEQFRMRGFDRPDAEIVWRGDDPLTEMVFPEPVDDNSGRQWIVFSRQPLGLRRAASGGVRIFLRAGRFRHAAPRKWGNPGVTCFPGFK